MSRYRDEQEDLLYKEAKKTVKRKKGFYGHLSVFISVGIFFLLVNVFIAGTEELFFYMPMIPWSLALSIHYFAVFGLPFTGGVLTKDWENEELEKEMDKLKYKYDVADKKNAFPEEKLDLPVIEKRKDYNEQDFV